MTIKSEIILFLKKSYLSSGKPVKNAFSKLLECKNVLNEETQLKILQATLLHPTAIKYPNKSYALQFLKVFINLIEESSFEICEEVYEIYSDLISKPIPVNELRFHSYLLDDNNCITLEESTFMIGENTTGLHTWEAGKQLAEWCSINANLFNGKCILELGSGIGLSGITVSIMCNPRKYIFTDCNERVLQLLDKNLKLNNDLLNLSLIELKNLHWGCSSSIKQIADVDFIIAADVIYDPHDHPVLCNTIKQINPKHGTFMAMKERDPETRFKFEKCLEETDLLFEIMEPAKDKLFINPKDDIFFVYKIKG